MAFKPVGVDENNLFPARVETRLATMTAADRARANHTGTQLHGTISDWNEAVQDTVGAMVVAGANVTATYDDAGGTLTIASTGGGSGGSLDSEAVQDIVGAMVGGTSPITATYNDSANTLVITTSATVNSTDAALRARSSHTGTQVAATISDFAAAVLVAAVDKMDSTEALSLAQMPSGGIIVIDYYKTSYGAANAWPTTRPTGDTTTVYAWLGPSDPGSIMISGDLFWLDA